MKVFKKEGAFLYVFTSVLTRPFSYNYTCNVFVRGSSLKTKICRAKQSVRIKLISLKVWLCIINLIYVIK